MAEAETASGIEATTPLDRFLSIFTEVRAG